MPHPRLAGPLALLLALAGCATLTPEECRTADWYRIGVADGAEGWGTGRIEQHRRACAETGVSPDAAAWLRGRLAGLRQYCTPATAHEVGRRGGAIAPGCTEGELVTMRPAHRWGEIFWQLGLEIVGIEADIAAAEAELRHLPPAATSTRIRLQREILWLESRLILLHAEQRRYAYWPP